ncbi:hypothetical protein PCC7424_3687 [Gloeothece citriformis PCC 7424]|uniref:Uncharacterized protein n=1 Tax=Gloeothece citriformis (strain PCC 7424) TaxID=65393 RepID=B7KHX1_GLOC7|nr:hypothetical protein [Gloeothece citriformis]ACK72068.1 hypothetical protein PCC7424_3687 [Gloeothece citriformis PCC 7424]
MSQTIYIKTETREEFEEAESQGSVYGYYNGRTNMCAYVELGIKGIYQPKPKDDPKTTYKIFYHCNIYLAKTMEILEAGGQAKIPATGRPAPPILDKTVRII